MLSYHNPYSDDAHALPHAKREKTDYIIQKVIQALNILEMFHDEVDELSLTELSKRLTLNESSVEMLLATLKSRNYIEKNNSTGNYRLGFKNLELAQTVLKQIDLYRVSHPVLMSISLACGETTAIAVLRKSHVIELDAIQSEQPVQVVSRVGVHLPVHCTAAGKMLLASQSPKEMEAIVSSLELGCYTRNTTTSVTELRNKLPEILEKGYAVDDEELDQDVRSVAAAIHDYAGLVVGAVAITGPSCRITTERLAGEMADLVQNGAREISARLGFHGPEAMAPADLVVPEGKASPLKKTRATRIPSGPPASLK
jgi:DNA-binding IclR family transcriptional regulator